MIAGFNANVRVFMSYNPLTTMEMAWGVNTVVDWERQKKILHESLHRCKTAVAELPSELIVWPSASMNYGDQHNGASVGSSFIQSSEEHDLAMFSPNDADTTPEDRRRRQYEIQKANIYASSLCTRSYLVEKYFSLHDAYQRTKQAGSAPISPGMMGVGLDGLLDQASGNESFGSLDQEMAEERESIVKDLLVVLSNIDSVNMEPNADSFVSQYLVALNVSAFANVTHRRQRSASWLALCLTYPSPARDP